RHPCSANSPTWRISFLTTFLHTRSTPPPAPLRPFPDRRSPPEYFPSPWRWTPLASLLMWRISFPTTFRDSRSTLPPAVSPLSPHPPFPPAPPPLPRL